MARSDNAVLRPLDTAPEAFIAGLPARRQPEARALIELLERISGQPAVMWGGSIIGVGSVHYRTASGREGDMPGLGFSPRKAKLTFYFSEGFDAFSPQLARLGKHTRSVSCLYANRLADLDLGVLTEMLTASWHQCLERGAQPPADLH